MKIQKVAKLAQKNPYKICRIAHGNERCLEIEVEAYTAEQARMFAFKQHGWLYDYIEMGYEIVARLNVEKVKAREEEARMEEEQIQDAWWNK